MPKRDGFGGFLVSANAKRGLILRALVADHHAGVAGEIVTITGELRGWTQPGPALCLARFSVSHTADAQSDDEHKQNSHLVILVPALAQAANPHRLLRYN